MLRSPDSAPEGIDAVAEPTTEVARVALRRVRLTMTIAIATPAFIVANAQATQPSTPQAADRAFVIGKWAGMAGPPTDRVPIAMEIADSAGQLNVSVTQFSFFGTPLPGALMMDSGRYVLPGYGMTLEKRPTGLEGTILFRVPVSLKRVTSIPHEVPVPRIPVGPGPMWRTKLGAPIYAAAAVHDSTIYVGTTGGMLYALDARTGRFRWAFAAGKPIFGGALVTDSAVYVACDNGFLFKVARENGTEVWRYDLGDAQASRIMEHQVVDNSGDFDWDVRGPTPVLADSLILIGAGDGGFHAVHATTGKQVWRYQAKGKIRGTAAVDTSRVMFGTFDGWVVALDRRTGSELWTRDTRGPITSSAVLVAGRLIAGNRNGGLYALEPASGEVAWRMLFWGSSVESDAIPADGSRFFIGSSDLRRISYVDATDGRVLYRTDVYGVANARPALTESTLFGGAVGFAPYNIRHLGSFFAMDRSTGQLRWRWPVPESPGELVTGFYASPIVAGPRVIVGGLDGTLYTFPASP